MIKNPGEINLDEALNICKEALKKGRELDLMPLTVTVVDVAGVVRASLSEEGRPKPLTRPPYSSASAPDSPATASCSNAKIRLSNYCTKASCLGKSTRR